MAATEQNYNQNAEMNAEYTVKDLKQNQAVQHLCEYLEERSELPVEIEETRVGPKPVLKNLDGTKPHISEFPDGFKRSTFKGHRDTVIDFINSQGINSTQEITPQDVSGYLRLLRRRGNKKTSQEAKLINLKVYLSWCESQWLTYNYRNQENQQAGRGRQRPPISETVQTKIDALDLDKRDRSRAKDENHSITNERAETILGKLAKYRYGSREMVEYLILLHTGVRLSGLLCINVDDVDFDRSVIKIRHRPRETGVRLKKGLDGERDINIKREVASTLRDYVDNQRTDPHDDSDALITTRCGRIDGSTVNRDINYLTACENCRETLTKQTAGECNHSIGPHDVRRTAITRMRDMGMDWEIISDRVNTSVTVLKEHYDTSDHAEKAKRRREQVMRTF